MNKLKNITIVRAEGPSELCGIKYEFKTFKEANQFIKTQENTFADLGYDKHDFELIFEDPKDNYKGRLDLMHPKNRHYDERANNVYFHVLDFMNYLLTDDKASKAYGISENEKIEIQAFIKNLERIDVREWILSLPEKVN
jgi:hypothetical protein